MTLKLEENELLAALMATNEVGPPTAFKDGHEAAIHLKARYIFWLREFIELNKAEAESRMRDGETK